MADKPKLLPCPFCGSDQLKISPNVYDGLLRVQCEACWATSVTSNQRATVVDAWNKRTAPARRAPGIDPKTGKYSTAQMMLDEMAMGDTSQPLFD